MTDVKHNCAIHGYDVNISHLLHSAVVAVNTFGCKRFGTAHIAAEKSTIIQDDSDKSIRLAQRAAELACDHMLTVRHHYNASLLERDDPAAASPLCCTPGAIVDVHIRDANGSYVCWQGPATIRSLAPDGKLTVALLGKSMYECDQSDIKQTSLI